jgi:dihydrofolate synthase/folylpolyglutamate synthase
MYQRIGGKAYKADLSRSLALDQAFNSPHKNFKTIHIAGTNGKGSVSSMLHSVLLEANYKVGLYTSPHLVDYRERIRINGKMIPEEYVIQFIENNQSLIESVTPSFFEITTALAFLYFAEENIDVAVIETGLGGRLDSTNIISPVVSCITNIGLDHTEFLGDSMESIANEKAGIIKHNTPVIIGETDLITKVVFDRYAKKHNSHIIYADQQFDSKIIHQNTEQIILNVYNKKEKSHLSNLKCDLPASYQKKNINTSLTIISELINQEFSISDESIYNGFFHVKKNSGLKGRWHVLNKKPLTICDAGHNEEGMNTVLNELGNLTYKKIHFVLGFVNDKDVDKILEKLPKNACYYFTKADLPRSLDAQVLFSIAQTKELKGEVFSSVSEAYDSAKSNATNHDLIFIGGSSYLIAEIL